ncbi:hypothetical protein E1182_16520 [Micromonospora sp. KC721]|nr:hypothetical protein E1182_16520 [Micromonospora sp. KC721]
MSTTMECLAIPSAFVPTHSALPGRRLPGWPPTIPECPSAPPEALTVSRSEEAPKLPSTMGARGFLVCRAAGGAGTAGVPAGACAWAAGSPSGDPSGSAPGRRRERPARRAALIVYGNFALDCAAVFGVGGDAVTARCNRSADSAGEPGRAVLLQGFGAYVAPFGEFAVCEADGALLLGSE